MRIFARRMGQHRRKALTATYVGQAHSVSGASSSRTLSLPGGAIAGDLAMAFVNDDFASTPADPTGWTNMGSGAWPAYGYAWTLSRRLLTSGDIAAGTVTATANTTAPMLLMIYRGVTSAVLINNNDCAAPNDTILTHPGFTKNVGSAGIVSVVVDRDASGAPAPPSGLATHLTPFAATNYLTAFADLLTPSAYTNGASLTWTGFTGSFFQHGWLIELRF